MKQFHRIKQNFLLILTTLYIINGVCIFILPFLIFIRSLKVKSHSTSKNTNEEIKGTSTLKNVTGARKITSNYNFTKRPKRPGTSVNNPVLSFKNKDEYQSISSTPLTDNPFFVRKGSLNPEMNSNDIFISCSSF